jgi:POT family proton-dependent oligopeptide transporter
MNQSVTTADSEKSDKFPPQIKYIIGNEVCERYSFYGMRSILTMFMIQTLLFTKGEAEGVYHFFVSMAYFTPLLGGYIADRFWGKFKTIMILSLFYCLGHAVLAFMDSDMLVSLIEPKYFLYLGLFFIGLGAGGIKPCVSANVGDQFTKKNQHLINTVFNWFYLSINFGSFFSSILTPWIWQKWGSGWAFGIPGILMGMATIIFWMGRHQMVKVPPSGKNPHGTLAVLTSSIKNFGKGQGFFGGAAIDHPAPAVDAVRAAFNVGRIFIPIVLFWALFDQHGSTWVVQASKMDLNFLGFTINPSQTSALNPILVLLMVPVFTLWIYPGLEKAGIAVTPLRKMSAGMFFAALSFVFMAWNQYRMDSGSVLNISNQILPYWALTTAEILISITGLEFAYTQAPRVVKSTIMGLWFLSVSLGNLLAGLIAASNKFEGGHFFMFFAVLTFIFSFVFIAIAKTYKMQNFVEADRQ